MRIDTLKGSTLNQDERLEIGRLLLKAGYVVRVGKDNGSGQSAYYIEYWEPGKGGKEENA